MHTTEKRALGPSFLGTARTVTVHRFGAGRRPKVYIQAGLHANEIPGLLVIQHLLPLLIAADREGAIAGEIVVVPFANPIGLGNYVLGNQVGRLALESGINYNRGFPDLGALVAPRVEGALGADAAANVALIRAALVEAVAELPARTEIEAMRKLWLELAVDCDTLLDLHCEEDALFAAILGPWCWPAMNGVVADLQPDAVFLADAPPLFDTACSRPWHDLAQRYPAHPIPQACLSVTLELRGVGAVDDATAARDAARILTALRRIDAVAGDPGPAPDRVAPARPFKAVEFVRAPRAGIVTYRYHLGDPVEAGAVVAEIVDPEAADPSTSRTPVRATEAGTLFAKCHTYLVRADETVAKIAGTTPLAQPNHY